jgi:phospholipid transport system transporter-binding protein
MMAERGGEQEEGAAFTRNADGGRWTYAGALTYANAGDILAAAAGLQLPAAGEIDLSDIGAVDSAAVAVLVALKRRATAEGRPLRFTNVPAALTTLADLYGVEEILVT